MQIKIWRLTFYTLRPNPCRIFTINSVSDIDSRPLLWDPKMLRPGPRCQPPEWSWQLAPAQRLPAWHEGVSRGFSHVGFQKYESLCFTGIPDDQQPCEKGFLSDAASWTASDPQLHLREVVSSCSIPVWLLRIPDQACTQQQKHCSKTPLFA